MVFDSKRVIDKVFVNKGLRLSKSVENWFGKAAGDGERRANTLHPTCRGNGDGMYAQETRRNTGSPSGDRGRDQLATRERQAGPCGVAERFVVPRRPGNSGGGKGPQLKTDATSNKGGTVKARNHSRVA